jgi:hypothetical protein
MLKLILSVAIASLILCSFAVRRYAATVFATRLVRAGTDQAGQGSGQLAEPRRR